MATSHWKSEDIESNFREELKRKLQTRRTGRVVRMDVEENADPWIIRVLKIQWDIDDGNIIPIPRESMIDFTGLLRLLITKNFKDKRAPLRPPRTPVTYPEHADANMFELLKKQDILLHRPYDSMDPVISCSKRQRTIRRCCRSRSQSAGLRKIRGSRLPIESRGDREARFGVVRSEGPFRRRE